MATKPEEILEKKARESDRLVAEFMRKKRAEFIKTVEKYVVEAVKLRSRKGKDEDGTDFDKLSDSYIKLRKRYKKNLHPSTRPGKSNITATGQLVDAIFADYRRNGYTLLVRDTKRKGELTGAPSRLTNQAVAAYVEANGRLFIGLTPKELERFVDELTKKVIKFATDQLGA